MGFALVIVFYSEKSVAVFKSEAVVSREPLSEQLKLKSEYSEPLKLKSECCEKYLKGKRCKRCPCFDLPNGPASLLENA